jgi:penicillin-binding protein A
MMRQQQNGYHWSRKQLWLVALSVTALLAIVLMPSPRGSDTATAADPAITSEDISAISSESMIAGRGSQPNILDNGELLALKRRDLDVGRIYPPPHLKQISISAGTEGALTLSQRPILDGRIGEHYANITENNNYVFYTVDPELQEFVSDVVAEAQANHVAVVVMNPRTGAILAIAGKSKTIPNIEYHADFPAASLFKVVTAAAAIEQAGIAPTSLIPFRGGTYTLNEYNYLPDSRRDRRVMSVGEALGRSCNPVFGHLGSRYLNGSILSMYARRFSFNQPLGFEAPLGVSLASIPQDNLYEISRTAAGFGEVRISPIHAATIASGIANGGLLPRPHIVDKIVSPDGLVLHRNTPDSLNRAVEPATARDLMKMMEFTTTVGTSRREFMRGSRATLGNLSVAAKTGTLKGTNPIGLNNWFIGAAPINDPQLAVAVITVDPRYASKASHLGRLIFQRFFNITPLEPVVVKKVTARSSGKYKVSAKKSRTIKKQRK